jgi:hypothetical protein
MVPLEKDRAEERRTEPRCLCHRHCLVRFDRPHLDDQPGSVGAEGYISDVSAAGVGLLLRMALPSGATLAIVPFGSDAVLLPPARVVRCIPAGSRWWCGCRFERHLSEEELRGWLA